MSTEAGFLPLKRYNDKPFIILADKKRK